MGGGQWLEWKKKDGMGMGDKKTTNILFPRMLVVWEGEGGRLTHISAKACYINIYKAFPIILDFLNAISKKIKGESWRLVIYHKFKVLNKYLQI